MLLWHRETIFMEREDVALNCFANVGDGGFSRFTLRDTAWKTGALGNPEAILTWMNEYLPHGTRIPDVSESSTKTISDRQQMPRKREYLLRFWKRVLSIEFRAPVTSRPLQIW